ncbi:MAG TPA: cupredoxin domain-containing protein [Chitinophagaceae bacterium]
MKKIFLLTSILLTMVSACEKNVEANGNLTATDFGQIVTVSIKNNAFSPDSLVVTRGATVVWKNDDNTTHTVTAFDQSFDSGDIAPGASFKYNFTTFGTFNYRCSHHPEMIGRVIVIGHR